MKSYEEMTQSVLTRAKAERQMNKRRQTVGWITAAVAGCMCLALLAVVKPGETAPQTPTQQLVSEPKARIMLLGSQDDARPKELIRDVVEPYRYLIRVLDAEGMNDEERKALMDAEKAYAQQLWAPGETNRMFTCYGEKAAIISLMSAGRLMLVVDDYDLIRNYTVTTTENGYISDYAHVHKDAPGLAQGIGFGWTLSNAAIEKIREEPGIELSVLSDTITVVVEFVDGTSETVIADVIIQDDGQVFIVHRGTTTAA